MRYNVVLLDDHQVVLESFANLLDTVEQLQVVGLAQDEDALRAILAQTTVHVLVTDLMMPHLNGPDLIARVKRQHPGVAVLVLSGSEDPVLIRQAMQAGADGYVTKTADKTELLGAVQAVALGRRYVDSRVFELTSAQPAHPGTTPLTKREAQVADLILAELSSAEIAERLFISFNTVETHRKHIYQKLGVNTALGLMKFSLRWGFTKR